MKSMKADKLKIINAIEKKLSRNGIKIIAGGETITLYFDQNLDFNEQKQKISAKVTDLNKKVSIIGEKLKNKSFLQKAPKNIVAGEKKALVEYKIELKKLNSILNSIKN